MFESKVKNQITESSSLMKGFPPTEQNQVNKANMLMGPYNRWAFHHLRELVPTIQVWAGENRSELPKSKETAPLMDIEFKGIQGETLKVSQWLERTYTDGFMVLRDGKVMFDFYASGIKAHEPHLLMSVTKAVNGILATDLIAQGELDPHAKVSHYIPELKGTAYEKATVQQNLDMTAAIGYLERYDGIDSNLEDYVIAAGMGPEPDGYEGPRDIYSYLKTLKQSGTHGEIFNYRSVNPEVSGWIIQRITGMKINEYLSERIWQPMGACDDAYFVADRNGMGMSGGGLNASLRDLAKFGEVVRNRGQFNNRQILDPRTYDLLMEQDYPVKVTEDLYGLSRPNYSYHNYWWIPNSPDKTIEGWGINGQIVHINPTTNTVIAKQSSRVQQSNDTNQMATMARNAFATIDHFWDK